MTDRPLDVRGAYAVARQMSVPMTQRQMSRWATEGKLPFKTNPLDRKLYISESRLRQALCSAFHFDEFAPETPRDLPPIGADLSGLPRVAPVSEAKRQPGKYR